MLLDSFLLEKNLGLMNSLNFRYLKTTENINDKHILIAKHYECLTSKKLTEKNVNKAD